jgi:hypothetical protein
MLKEVNIYTTSICNSECKLCDIHKNKTRVDFDFDWFKNAVVCNLTDELLIMCNEVTEWKHFDDFGKLVQNGALSDRNYIILSNCRSYKKLLKYPFKQFTISWDGSCSDKTRYQGCTYSVTKFFESLGATQTARIAYLLSPFNFHNLESDFKAIQRIYDSTDANTLQPYFLIATNLPYFGNKKSDNYYGFGWLKKIFEKHSFKFLDFINSAKNNDMMTQYTYNVLWDLAVGKGFETIYCSNPYHSLHIDCDGSLRYCPGSYWNYKLIDSVYDYSNFKDIYRDVRDDLYRSIYCDKKLQCGVGCRYHIDAREMYAGFLEC